jgi:hypothetical protein
VLRVAIVGQFSKEKLIKHDPEGPNISFVSIWFLAQNLWRHVYRCTYKCSVHFACFSKKLSEAKVTNFECLLIYKDVGRFQIAMNYSKFVHLFESFGYLLDDIQGHFFIYFAGGAKTL